MGILSLVPNLLIEAEKVVPGHGAELFQVLDLVSTANCSTCNYMRINQNREGYCYMFRSVPDEVCMLHTFRQNDGFMAIELVKGILGHSGDTLLSERLKKGYPFSVIEITKIENFDRREI